MVVGPEAPLVDGLVDLLAARGVTAFGPTREAAQLEGSKAFAKEIMEAAGVPTATWRAVSTVEDGMEAIERYPVVIKFDGLAAGKGVIVAGRGRGARERSTRSSCRSASAPGAWWSRSALDGEELSLLALCDGETRGADGAGAGLQADLRRRHGPEHRRHGLLLAGARHRPRAPGGMRARRSTSRWSTSCARRGIALPRRASTRG